MNKFQNVSFKNIHELLSYLPDEELRIVEPLRELALECIPGVKEKLAYNVPFYYRYSRICYIWPACVPWGGGDKKGVQFGFCKGNLLSDPSYLDIGTRKEVFTKTFNSTKEIDWERLRQLLFEAVVIDEEEATKKMRGKRKLRS